MHKLTRRHWCILQGCMDVLLLLMALLLPLCADHSYFAAAFALLAYGKLPAVFGVFMLLAAVVVAGNAVVTLTGKAGPGRMLRLSIGAHAALTLAVLVLNWFCVALPGTVAEWMKAEACAFCGEGYALILAALLCMAVALKLSIVHVVRRMDMAVHKRVLIRVAAILLSVLVSMLMVLVIGYDPLQVFKQIYLGSIGTQAALVITLQRSIPLIMIMLSVVVSFKLHFWNVGTGGQLVIGAICASFFAYNCASSLPHWLLILCMFVSAAIGGALWALIPALAKLKWRTNECLFTLMLNYIATYLIQFLRRGPWEDPMMPSFGQCAMFDNNARLSKLLGIPSSWVVAVAAVILVTLYLRYTRHGFEITVCGEQPGTAAYVGINVRRVVIRTVLISGAIAGTAGMLKLCGADFKLNETIAGDLGFSAITIAWLAKLDPLASSFVAILYSAVSKGCESLSMSTTLRVNGVSIPSASATVIIGIVLLFVLGCEFFINYKLVLARDNAKGADEL